MKIGPYDAQIWPPTPEDQGFVAVYIPASKSTGDVHTVIVEVDRSMTCSCKSFYYQSSYAKPNCKHLDLVRPYLTIQ